MSSFIIQFVVYSGLLYLAYRHLLSKLSFYQANRVVLLAIPAIAACIPLVAPMFSTPLAMPLNQLPLLEVVLTPQATANPSASQGYLSIGLLVYGGITSILLSAMIHSLYRGFQILKKSSFENGVWYSAATDSPFTFFKHIILPNSLKNTKELSVIIAHEKIHVQQKHGWDNLFYSLLSSLAWFNPFIHLLAKELKQTHECQADDQALKNTSREAYALLLLSSAFGSKVNPFPTAMGTASPFFNSSLIKTRIEMIYKEKSTTKGKWRYLALVPLLTFITLFACNKTENQTAEMEKALKALDMNTVDQLPLFENCEASASMEEQQKCFQIGVMTYISKNFRYPDNAYELGLEGKIYVEFVINEKGVVSESSIARGLVFEDAEKQTAAEETNNYAAQLLKGLPEMSPAKKDGKEVSMKMVVPISLKMPPNPKD